MLNDFQDMFTLDRFVLDQGCTNFIESVTMFRTKHRNIKSGRPGSLQNGTMHFDLNGTAAGVVGGYNQLKFAAGNLGSINLGSALPLSLGFAPVVGEQFELIDVGNSNTLISGYFVGLGRGLL